MNQNSFCIKNCEYLTFNSGNFKCKYYEIMLDQGISLSKSSMRPLKCPICYEENKIPTENAKQIIMDSLETIEGHIEWIRELIEPL